MNKFILIGYKPSSDNYCKGCHMASYSSDFILEEYEYMDSLAKRIAEISKTVYSSQEDKYVISLIFNGNILFKGMEPYPISLLNYDLLYGLSEEDIATRNNMLKELNKRVEAERISIDLSIKEKVMEELRQLKIQEELYNKKIEEDEKKKLIELVKKYPDILKQ